MKIKTIDVLICGFALFAIFFGAGNLIFPPYLGVVSGQAWPIASLAFVLSDSFFAILGVLVTMSLGGRAEDLGKRVNPRFAILLEAIAILLIGPLFSVPRTGATTHEVFIQSFFPAAPQWITSLVFFGITGYVAINPSKVMDTIGKYLTPILLAILALVCGAAVLHPVAPIVEPERAQIFAYSFKEGYQTMDALGAALMAGIVALDLKRRGYQDRKTLLRASFWVGALAFVLLAVVYMALTFAGATVSSLFTGADDRTRIFVEMIDRMLGYPGRFAMGLTVAFACLTTSIGLTSICGHFFSTISKEKWSYRQVILATVAVEFLVSLIGVNAIINIAVPVLTAIYPMIMFLILSSLFDRQIKSRAFYVGGVWGAGAIGTCQALAILAKSLSLPGLAGMADWTQALPLANLGFEWVLPTLALALLTNWLLGKKMLG